MRSKMFAVVVGLCVALVAGLAPAVGAPNRAMHDVTYVTNPSIPFLERTGKATVIVERLQHGLADAEVDYSTEASGGATAGVDYMDKAGTMTLAPVQQREVLLDVLDDGDIEEVETFTFNLDSARGGTVLRFPKSATVTIVDNDGPTRISFANTEPLEAWENRGAAAVTLIRSGSDLSGTASVTLTSANGTAESPADYQEVSEDVTFAANEFRKTVLLALENDKAEESTEDLTLTLSAPSGADISEPASASVHVLDDDSGSADFVAPRSQFHLPQNKATYRARQARQIHLFSSDAASGVAKMWLALRKKMRNGKCAWWGGRKFSRGKCSKERWIDLGKLPQNYFVVYKLKKKLTPSTRKTGIRNYTVFGRARDEAGNFELTFKKGRNMNTYKIKP
jgi:Calx-beta domain